LNLLRKRTLQERKKERKKRVGIEETIVKIKKKEENVSLSLLLME